MAHKSVLETLTTATRGREVRARVNGRIREAQVGGIEDPEAAAGPMHKGGRVAREGKVKTTGKIKGNQAVGIVDLVAAVCKGGRATKNPREEKDGRGPPARDPPRKPQRRVVHDLTMSSMAL